MPIPQYVGATGAKYIARLTNSSGRSPEVGLLEFETAPTWAIAPSGGQTSVIRGLSTANTVSLANRRTVGLLQQAPMDV